MDVALARPSDEGAGDPPRVFLVAGFEEIAEEFRNRCARAAAWVTGLAGFEPVSHGRYVAVAARPLIVGGWDRGDRAGVAPVVRDIDDDRRFVAGRSVELMRVARVGVEDDDPPLRVFVSIFLAR